LLALAASAALPVRGLGAPARRRSVGIVGGGMAGVSLAWLLDGACDIVLLEARDSIGGNVQSVEVDLDGSQFVIDMGAQYFHPALYPAYTALLGHLGLGNPVSSEPSVTRPFPASITLTAGVQSTPRFVSPALPERWWPFFAPWNAAGLWAFGLGFFAAKIREQLNQPWDLTLEEWLPTLGLSREQWEGMLLPWAASLFSGSVDQARGMSARAAMIFAAKALPPNLFDPILYYVLTAGMIEVLSRMIAECSSATILTGAPLLEVSRNPTGGFTLRSARRTVHVDDLVFASSGPPTARLLTGFPGATPQLAALSSMAFHDARLALHTDPLYASPNTNLRSFLNCDLQGDFCEASMWLASVAAAPPLTAAKVWKSWITHRERPKQVLYETVFTHMLPTPATLQAQDALGVLQGRDGLWFAGGYLYPYDSQETALLSALRVALGLHVTSPRSEMLLAALSTSSANSLSRFMI
jgi:predicted NAD/FAD-binding protein